MNLLSNERAIAVEAVLQASRVCQQVRARLVCEETVIKKDRSPVTVADFSAQAIISHSLKQAFPNDRLVAEESAADLIKLGDDSIQERVFEWVRTIHPALSDTEILEAIDAGNDAGGSTSRFWTLDPIDGTKGFLRGEQYAISLALIEEGQVVFGILGCPNFPTDWSAPHSASGNLFIAERRQGAFMRGMHDPQETAIRVSEIGQPEQAVFCESVESGHSAHDVSQAMAERLGVIAPPLRIDSQCKYAAVARGDATVYLRLPTRADYEEKIWDHAAGVIVLEEAGGCVTDVRGNPLDFSRGRTLALNKGVVASNGWIHEGIIQILKSGPFFQ